MATTTSSHSHTAAIPSSSLSLLSSAHLSLLPSIPSLDFSLRHVNPPQPSPRLATKQGSRPGKMITVRRIATSAPGYGRHNQRPFLGSSLPSPSLPPSLSIFLLLSPPAPLFAAALSLARDRVGETMTFGPPPSAVIVMDGGLGARLPSTVLSGHCRHPSSLPSLPLSLPFLLSLRLEHAGRAMPGTRGQAMPSLVHRSNFLSLIRYDLSMARLL